jgi:hypothetical protein
MSSGEPSRDRRPPRSLDARSVRRDASGLRWRAVLSMGALIVLGGANVGCQGDDTPGHDPAACTSFVVPTTLGLGWQNLNHRISRWGVQLAPAPGEACAADTLAAEHVGGDYTTGESATDTARVVWEGSLVDAAGPHVLGAARLRVPFEIGPGAEATLVLPVARSDAHLLGYGTVIAFIEGLRLTTDVPQGADYPADYDPAHGYTSRGLGAWVRVATSSADTIQVEAGVHFAHGPSDRDDMNRAIPHARTEATLDVLLLGVADGPVLEGHVSTTVTCPRPGFLVDVPCPGPGEADGIVELSGPPGAPPGLAGWTGFRFDLETPDDPGHGEYLRELRVTLTRAHHDPTTGAAAFRAFGYASHASKFTAFHDLEVRFDASIAWIPAPVQASIVRVEQAFATGRAVFPLDPESP